MKKRKPLKQLRTSALSRSFSLARLGLEASARAAGNALTNLISSEAGAKARKQAMWLAQATSLVEELGELKGSLMKTGQLLSVYGEHFLPPEINALLRTLQSDSPPVEFAEIHKVLMKSLGKEKLALLEIEENPCGAASLGQVHKARVRATGEWLALKVQYPGVDRAIDGDIRTLKKVLSLTEWLPRIPATDELFEEVRSMLKREVNYPLELEMLEFYGEKLKDDPRYIVPRTFRNFSGKRVIAMSFEAGIPLDSNEVAELPESRRNALSLAVLDLYFRELFHWRRVQTDPHFGNFRVRLGKTDALVLYDFGAVRDLSEPFMREYSQMLKGTFSGNRALFEEASKAIGVLEDSDPEELKEMFYKLCLMLTEPFLDPQPYQWRDNNLAKRVTDATWEIFRKFPLRAPPREVVFLDRKMAGNFTLLSRLGANINARELLGKYL